MRHSKQNDVTEMLNEKLFPVFIHVTFWSQMNRPFSEYGRALTCRKNHSLSPFELSKNVCHSQWHCLVWRDEVIWFLWDKKSKQEHREKKLE